MAEVILSGGLSRLAAGVQAKMVDLQTTPGTSNTYIKEFNIESDALALGVWVNSVGAGGSATVKVYTLPEDGKPVVVISVTPITAPTTSLRFQKSAIVLQRLRIEVEVQEDVDIQIYARAINAAGEASTRLLGASNIQVSQIDVSTTPVVVLPADTVDRVGVVLKNWSASGDLYTAETSIKATTALGFPVGPKGVLVVNVEAGAEIWGYSPNGPVDIRIMEATAAES